MIIDLNNKTHKKCTDIVIKEDLKKLFEDRLSLLFNNENILIVDMVLDSLKNTKTVTFRSNYGIKNTLDFPVLISFVLKDITISDNLKSYQQTEEINSSTKIENYYLSNSGASLKIVLFPKCSYYVPIYLVNKITHIKVKPYFFKEEKIDYNSGMFPFKNSFTTEEKSSLVLSCSVNYIYPENDIFYNDEENKNTLNNKYDKKIENQYNSCIIVKDNKYMESDNTLISKSLYEKVNSKVKDNVNNNIVSFKNNYNNINSISKKDYKYSPSIDFIVHTKFEKADINSVDLNLKQRLEYVKEISVFKGNDFEQLHKYQLDHILGDVMYVLSPIYKIHNSLPRKIKVEKKLIASNLKSKHSLGNIFDKYVSNKVGTQILDHLDVYFDIDLFIKNFSNSTFMKNSNKFYTTKDGTTIYNTSRMNLDNLLLENIGLNYNNNKFSKFVSKYSNIKSYYYNNCLDSNKKISTEDINKIKIIDLNAYIEPIGDYLCLYEPFGLQKYYMKYSIINITVYEYYLKKFTINDADNCSKYKLNKNKMYYRENNIFQGKLAKKELPNNNNNITKNKKQFKERSIENSKII